VLLPGAIADHVGDRRLVLVEDGQSGATVYRIRNGATDWFLKVGHGAAAGLVVDETVRLRWLAGRLPTARVVEAVQVDGAAWLLTTAVPGVPAGAYIKTDRRCAVAVAAQMAAFVSQLHALPVDDCPFDSSVATWLPVVRQFVAEGRVDTEDFDAEHDGWSAERVLAKVEENACHAHGRVVVHGDFSLGNLIVDGDGAITGCIDVGRLGVGDPYRDLFIGWRDLGGFGQVAQAAFLAALGIDELETPRRELHRALDELF
jgi:aminoglycoside 3'-phosphotransferase I